MSDILKDAMKSVEKFEKQEKDSDDLFDRAEAERLKKTGMESARENENRRENLELARIIARDLGRQYRLVNADMVGKALRAHGIKTLGPAGGSMFRGGEWKWTGDYIESVRITNHKRPIKVWQYLGN